MPRLFPTISAIVPALPAATFTHAGLHVGLTSRIVTVDGKEIGLAATKYALLRLLVRHAGRVLTHRQILREILGPNAEERRQ